MSIRWKLTLLIFAVTVIPAILLSYFTSQFGVRVMQQEVEGGMNLIVRVAEGAVNQYFGQISVQVSDWSSDAVIRSSVDEINDLQERGETDTAREISFETSDYIIRAKHTLSEEVLETEIFNTQGEIIVSTHSDRVGMRIEEEVRNRYYDFDRAVLADRGEAFINEVAVDTQEHVGRSDVMIHASTPVYSEDGQVSGVMVNHVSIAGLNDMLQQHTKAPVENYAGYEFVQEILDSIELYLVKKDGLVMATASRFVDGAPLSQLVDTQPVRVCVEEGRSMSGLYNDYRSVGVLGASRCPEDEWWVLVVEVDRVDALAPARLFRNVVATMVLGSTGVTVLLSFWIGHVFSRRIKKNADIIKQIEKGDFSARVEVESKDEIGQVGQGINDMAKELDTFYGSVNEMYENLFEKSPFGIYTIDKNGVIESFNPQMVELSGVDSAEEIIGTNALELPTYQDIGLDKEIRNALDQGRPFELEAPYNSYFGNKDTYRRFIGVPIHRPGQHGKVERVMMIVEDVSKRKEAEEELALHAEALEERVKERTEELQSRVDELERFKNVTVGRELKMRELKDKIEELKTKLDEEDAGNKNLNDG